MTEPRKQIVVEINDLPNKLRHEILDYLHETAGIRNVTVTQPREETPK